MRKKRIILLLIFIMTLTGCVQPESEETLTTVPVEVAMEPLLIPGETKPEIVRTDGGVRFHWPSTQWVMLEDDTGYIAMALDGTQYLRINPARLQLTMEEMSLEPLLLLEAAPLKEGILVISQNHQGGHGLAHIKNVSSGQFEWLLRDQQQRTSYLVSKDGSKVVYMNPEGILTTYHTVTGRKTNINNLSEEAFLDDWTRQIRLSPLGGYLTYENMDADSGRSIQFTIYGADSGRLIHDKLPGIKPRWNHNDQQVVFLLNPLKQNKMDTLSPEQIPEENQLGIYTLGSRQIDYFNRFREDTKLTAPPVFSDDNNYLIYAVADHVTHKIIIHHLEQQVQQAFTLPQGVVVVPGEEWASMDEEILVATFEDVSGYQLMVYHLKTEYTETISGIDTWTDETGKERWFDHETETGVRYLKNGWIMEGKKGDHKPLLKVPLDVKWVAIEHTLDWRLITIVQGRGEKSIYYLSL